MIRPLLHFDHVIPIKPTASAVGSGISRADLWKALVFRARYPGYFTPGLDCTLQPVDDTRFVRIISFADTQLRDEVTLTPHEHIHSIVDGRHQPMHAECRVSIEEPVPGQFAVRFCYRRDSISEHGGLDADEFLKSAYLDNDREAMTRLLEMIAEGWVHPHS
ncbi:DUF1857 family protein [Gammaproteobacteria bacterium LSUCC0112]|nr:DUF1857 family protein [Gammaproteobacteria bacterium LSUCC0112]